MGYIPQTLIEKWDGIQWSLVAQSERFGDSTNSGPGAGFVYQHHELHGSRDSAYNDPVEFPGQVSDAGRKLERVGLDCGRQCERGRGSERALRCGVA